MEETKEIVGLMIAFIAVTGGMLIPFVFFYVDNKKRKDLHQERMALIEKGANPQQIWPQHTSNPKEVDSKSGSMLWGLLFIGVGLGLLTGYFIGNAAGLNTTILMNGFAILSGGVFLILYYFLKGKNDRKKAK